jgi:hypothetical protein
VSEESFRVAIVAQEYPPPVIQRLAGLLNSSQHKIAARLQNSDLVVKKDVDESTAQQYAAIIYAKTGAEAVVLGGPDLSTLSADKPKATKAEEPSTLRKPTYPLLLAAGLGLVLLLLALTFLLLRPGPESALINAQAALQEGSVEQLEAAVDLTALAGGLYPTLKALPATEDTLQGLDQAVWLAEESNAIRSALTTNKLPAESTSHVVLSMLGWPTPGTLSAMTTQDSGHASAQVPVRREDLDKSYLLELALAKTDDGWQIQGWRNAESVLQEIFRDEQIKLASENQAIEKELASVLGNFRYEESIAGVHRFSLGQLLIEAKLANQNPQSLRAFSGELYVFGVSSRRVYASKDFTWQADERLLPPGGSASVEVFFSLDSGHPELLAALENKTEKLEVGYRIRSATFRDNTELRRHSSYPRLARTQPSTP